MSIENHSQYYSQFWNPWIAADLYPGFRPSGSYVMDRDGYIHMLEGKLEDAAINGMKINDFLRANNAASLDSRYPVLAYGSNACPTSVKSKLNMNSIVPIIK